MYVNGMPSDFEHAPITWIVVGGVPGIILKVVESFRNGIFDELLRSEYEAALALFWYNYEPKGLIHTLCTFYSPVQPDTLVSDYSLSFCNKGIRSPAVYEITTASNRGNTKPSGTFKAINFRSSK